MATHRTKAVSEEDATGGVPVTAGAAGEPVAGGDGAADARFEVLTWNQMPMWRCRCCPYDTVESEATIVEHYQREHVVAAPAPTVHIPVYDRWGNPR